MRKARTSCTLALLAPSTRQISETSSARPRNTSTYLSSAVWGLRTLSYSRTSVPWGCSRWWGRGRRCGPRPRGWPGPGRGCPWPPGTLRGSGAGRTPGDTPGWSSLRLCLLWSLELLLEPSSGQIFSPDHQQWILSPESWCWVTEPGHVWSMRGDRGAAAGSRRVWSPLSPGHKEEAAKVD